MAGHLIFFCVVVAAFDFAQVPVVSCLGIGNGQRKFRLERTALALPVDGIGNFDAVACVTRGQTDHLHKLRTFRVALDAERHAHRAVFRNLNLRRAVHITARRIFMIVPIHVPGRVLMRGFIQKIQPGRRGQQFAAGLFVKNARDVA